MIHPHTEVRFIHEEKGTGLLATRFIPQGTIMWVMDKLDREIPPVEMESYDELHRDILLTYSYRNSCGNYIFCWDNGRYINHSFNPNCCLTPFKLEIAIRDIQAGEEITDDYGYLNIIEPFEALPEGGERRIVYPDDLLRLADVWDTKVAATLPFLNTVEQPLKPFVPTPVWNTLQDILVGNAKMPSLRTCYFPGT